MPSSRTGSALATPVAAVASILVVALLLRLWGLVHDLPYVYHPDEPVNVGVAHAMFGTGDPNPHFFGYPSLLYYLNVAAYWLYYGIGLLTGQVHAKGELLPLVSLAMGVTRAPSPEIVVLGRALSVAFGLGAVLVTYLAGRKLLDSAPAAAIAALFVAVGPTSVGLSRVIAPDTLATFFVVATLLAAMRIFAGGTLKDYLLAGALAGLAASAKYNCGTIVVVIAAAHWLRDPGERAPFRHLLAAGLASVAGFLAGSPYALLDWPTFLHYLRFEGRHYTTGHPGMEGEALRWYLGYAWSTLGVASVLAVLEVGRGLVARSRGTFLLATFPVLYFAFISSFVVRNDRTFLPLTPFIALLAASFLLHAWQWAARRPDPARARAGKAACAVALAAALIPALATTLADANRLAGPDNRATARAWIEANLPAGATVAIESYAPFVDPQRYSVRAAPRMINREPAWYVDNGVDFLVFSEGMYGRYLQDPDRYAAQAAQYRALFAAFPVVKTFADGGYEVRIHRVERPAAGPAQPQPR